MDQWEGDVWSSSPTKLWFYYLRIFIRRKIRGVIQKFVLGHNNPIQAHGRDRPFLLSSTMAKIHPNCPCKTKPQMETSKTLGSGREV